MDSQRNINMGHWTLLQPLSIFCQSLSPKRKSLMLLSI